MEILIIGGARFVGPVLVDKLLAKNHKLTIFNRGQHTTDYPEGIAFIQGDRNDGFSIQQHFDVVIDMCAYTGTQTKAALEQLSYDFFIHFGTAAAYAKSQLFPLTERSPIGEWPVWGDYNKGKVECEQALLASGKKYASIRPVYILGAGNYLDRESFIYKRVNAGEIIILPGNGQAVSSFVFVQDVADILVRLAEKQPAGVFNCACDEALTLQGLVQEEANLVGKQPLIAYNQAADGENHNEDEFPFANENFICSNQKLKDLGFTFTPLVGGLKADFESYYRSRL